MRDRIALEQVELRLFGSTVLTDTVVVQRNPRGLSTDQVARVVSGTRDVARHRLPGDLAGIRAAVPLVNVPVPGVDWGERGTTALTYLLLGPELNLLERDAVAHRYAARYGAPTPGTFTGVTGAPTERK